MERLYAAAQECRGDLNSFSQARKRVVAGEAKKLPEALESIQARLRVAEDTVAANEEAARENDVCVAFCDVLLKCWISNDDICSISYVRYGMYNDDRVMSHDSGVFR